MYKLFIYDKDKKLIGHENLDSGAYKWHFEFEKSFEFIPEDYENFLFGKFSISDAVLSKKNEEIIFTLKKYKLLPRNKDLSKPFDYKSDWIDVE